MFKLTKKTALLAVVPLLLFIFLWIANERRPQHLPGLGGQIMAIAFSPDSQTVVCATTNDYVQMWMPALRKWRSFDEVKNYKTNLPILFARLRFSPDGQMLYAGGSAIHPNLSSVAHAWNVSTRRRKFAFSSLKGPAFDISPDGRWAALGHGNVVRLIDLNASPSDYREDPRFPRYADYRSWPFRKLVAARNVTCVAFSPDSQTLVVGDESPRWQLAFWSVSTGERISDKVSDTNLNAPTFLEWSPDGKFIAVADTDQLSIFELESQSIVETPWPAGPQSTTSYLGGIVPLAWSPDGQKLFSGGDEVRRWRASDLKQEHPYGVSGPVAVSPDGRTLATASATDEPQSAVLLWKLG